MAELPRLPKSLHRLQAVRWKELIKSYGFTGDHFKWHESHVRRREAAKPAGSLAPPPPSPLRGSGNSVTHLGRQGEQVSYENWRRQQMEDWAVRESDPSVIDSIGVRETLMLAKSRFAEIAGGYLSLWAETNGDSDEFTRWLEEIGILVEGQVRDLWRQEEWHAAWFERACRKEVKEALQPLIEEWKSRASRLEIVHLENPHISLRSLWVAGGNLNLAATFEQGEQAINAAQRALALLRSIDSETSSDDRPAQPTELRAASGAAGERAAAADTIKGSQLVDSPEPAARKDVRWHPGGNVNQASSASATAPVGSPPPANATARKRLRRNKRYEKIDRTLIEISAAQPVNHEEFFGSLEGRVPIPPAEPFANAGGWKVGFRKDRRAAQAWLSKRWALLELPPFPRGPK
jgi:hypothetical protein